MTVSTSAEVVGRRVQSVTLVLTGVLLGPSALLDADRAAILVALLAMLFAGFVLFVTSTAVMLWITRGWVNILAVAGAVLWLIGFIWPFSWGQVTWVPWTAFGGIAGVAFAAAAVGAAVAKTTRTSLQLALLSGGSLLSTGIALGSAPFTPQSASLPLALATLAAGVVGWPRRANSVGHDDPAPASS